MKPPPLQAEADESPSADPTPLSGHAWLPEPVAGPVAGDGPALVVTGPDLGEHLKSLDPPHDWRAIASLAEALRYANDTRPQALLIDASDHSETLHLLNAGLSYQPALLFVSSNPLFAHAAFELGAVDCLPKPVERARLALALERLKRWITPPPEPARPTEAPPQRWLRMVRNGSLLVTALDQVIYFQAERKLTRVVLADSDGYLHMGINAVAAKLDPHLFWRLHRSTIANGRFVSTVQRDDLGRLFVRMQGRPELLYVSKSHDAIWRTGIF